MNKTWLTLYGFLPSQASHYQIQMRLETSWKSRITRQITPPSLRTPDPEAPAKELRHGWGDFVPWNGQQDYFRRKIDRDGKRIKRTSRCRTFPGELNTDRPKAKTAVNATDTQALTVKYVTHVNEIPTQDQYPRLNYNDMNIATQGDNTGKIDDITQKLSGCIGPVLRSHVSLTQSSCGKASRQGNQSDENQ